MQFDTLITGGTITTHTRTFAGDIAISHGKIAALAQPGVIARSTAKEHIDAHGCEVIPGCMDVHVHLGLPFCGTVSCDDFEHGSRAAVSGCITSVIDFAIPSRGQTLRQAHQSWLEKSVGRSLVDFAWHMAITSDAHLKEVPAMIEMGNPTFKEFMIYEGEGWNSDDARMFTTLELMRDHGGMLLVHAESSRVLDELIRRHHTPAQMRMHGARLHPMTRPHVIEVEAIERAIRLCDATGGKLYIVHMSTGPGADLVKQAQTAGIPVLAETCVQYLVLDDGVFHRPDGHLFACCPQVKTRDDVERLWDGLGDEVCIVSTDTCSFTRAQKDMWWVNPDGSSVPPPKADAPEKPLGTLDPRGYGDWTKIPMGLPGLDTLVPLMYTLGVRGGRLTLRQLVELCAAKPAQVMGLWGRKGDIAPGFDADIVVIDPRESRTVISSGPAKTMRGRTDWSPYEGMTLHGFAKHTLVRGNVVVRDGEVVGTPGVGGFMMRGRLA